MKTLSRAFSLFCALAALPADGPWARSSMLDLTVGEKDGKPCFAPQPDGENRRYRLRLAWVSVAADPVAAAGPARVVWASGLPPPPGEYTTGAGECLLYGQRVAGETLITSPQPLQAGIRYTVTINAFLRAGSRGALNRRYAGQFCLARDRRGALRVHDLWHGARADVAADDPCRALFLRP
ncbi:hypothetical protein FJU30_10625 [Affinibrenneria salicis]|uniref:Uncharacterized protein n=1 Tax=Affinibrenneria salicis TaxID=2590031 RepID=A0A5J5G2G5_9GAMM|nr:hypothetical protein [Affinibrenneria salicis]KAA9000662.1 hypothetical protein FJU30_10625 [Affinibrenneria salicis]